MEHIFLFRPQRWWAEGIFIDDKGKETPTDGESLVTHKENFWVIDGKLKVYGEQLVEIKNRYLVKPMEFNGASTSWRSENPALGEMCGTFSLVDDSILSSYASVDGKYHGVETMQLLADKTYLARGSLFEGYKRISAWKIGLF